LPVPPSDQSVPLVNILRADIDAKGAISFREFMAAALYHPVYGYYASGRAAIGRSGDFFTSVTVGRLFGTLLARQFAEMWDRMDQPREFSLIEQGAHDGTLIEDVLLGMQAIAPDCLSAARPAIIEPSAVWRMKQSERLRNWPIEWVDSVDALEPFMGIHYSNELLDAFPVHLVRSGENAWSELYVEWVGDRFGFVDRPIDDAELRARLERINVPVPVGFRTEVNLEATWWMRNLSQKLKAGYILTVDYGCARAEYYRPDRREGTLEAIATHRREKDVLARPGELDLTAHVEFTSLAQAGLESGLHLEGFTDQHHFLVGLASRHFSDGEPPSASDMRAFQTLAHPTMLGRSFRVFAAGRAVNSSQKLSGFLHSSSAADELGLTDLS
jgi:SAM-dependent MidA family methyltransferase